MTKKGNVPCSECSTLYITFVQKSHEKSDGDDIFSKLEPSRQSNNCREKNKNQIIGTAHQTISFGSVEIQGKCTIPVKNKTADIGEVKFNDAWEKRMEGKLMELLPLFFNEPEYNIDKLVTCLKQVTLVLKKMKQRRDFTDPEMDQLQKQIDTWSHLWIGMVGESGMKKYTHLVCSGHMTYFLRRWRNLYRYSNQGWEYKNKQMRYVYHNRSQMGRNSGSGQHHSKLKPLGFWFLRCLWWMTREFPVVHDTPIPSLDDFENDGDDAEPDNDLFAKSEQEMK
jgi:hypothetical protein